MPLALQRATAPSATQALWCSGIRLIVTSCRAVVLPRFGGPEVLEVRHDVPVPNLKPRDVLLRTRAVSVNPLDTRMRSGYGKSIFQPLLPLVLGRDVSGEVAAVGDSVTKVAVGQEVFGALHPTAVRGTYADYALLSEEEVAPKPHTLTHVEIVVLESMPAQIPMDPSQFTDSSTLAHFYAFMEASAIPFAALTAWRALKCNARIDKGQRLLVLGGGGAVGLSAIQIAVAAGCSVSATCGSKSFEKILDAGAEQVVDYTTENIELAIRGKFDAVLDTIGVPETERIGTDLLIRGGHYMTLQGETASLADRYGLTFGIPTAMAILMRKQIQYRYSHGIAYWWTYMRADMEGLHEIRRLAEAGKLKIPVERTYPITQATEAHEVKEKRIVPGKVVLEVE